MATPSRTSLIKKLAKVLKKHYKPVVPDLERTVLDQLLFASCLENAHANAAEEAFAALVHNFFDWNEVRVSTVRELAEEMTCLPEPTVAGDRVKRVLQSVFEASYTFDLEELRKMNLGVATERLSKIDGTTTFTVAYVVRMSLGGHTIPVDFGTLQALWVVGLISEADIESGTVPGLERAVAKNKGIEFGSILHQLGSDFVATPYASSLRSLLKEIHPDCDDRLPRRRSRKTQSQAADTPATKTGSEKEKSKKKPSTSKADSSATPDSTKKPSTSKADSSATPASTKKPSTSKADSSATPASGKKSAKKKIEKSVSDKKKSPKSTPKSTPRKKKGKDPVVKKKVESKKGGVSGLSKRKPR